MYKLNIGTSMQYHNNVTEQIHNIVTHIYEEAKNMNTHNKHERCLQGGSKITLPDHIDFTDKITKKTHSAPEYTRGPRQGDIFFFNFEDEAIWLICKVSLLPAFEVFLELR